MKVLLLITLVLFSGLSQAFDEQINPVLWSSKSFDVAKNSVISIPDKESCPGRLELKFGKKDPIVKNIGLLIAA